MKTINNNRDSMFNNTIVAYNLDIVIKTRPHGRTDGHTDHFIVE